MENFISLVGIITLYASPGVILGIMFSLDARSNLGQVTEPTPYEDQTGVVVVYLFIVCGVLSVLSMFIDAETVLRFAGLSSISLLFTYLFLAPESGDDGESERDVQNH